MSGKSKYFILDLFKGCCGSDLGILTFWDIGGGFRSRFILYLGGAFYYQVPTFEYFSPSSFYFDSVNFLSILMITFRDFDHPFLDRDFYFLGSLFKRSNSLWKISSKPRSSSRQKKNIQKDQNPLKNTHSSLPPPLKLSNINKYKYISLIKRL